MPHTWHILGFTSDDIIGAWQDARLAEACAEAWRSVGEPPGFVAWGVPGEGEHLIHWYLASAVTDALDRRGVAWRQFRLGQRTSVPPGASKVFSLGE